MSNDNGQSRPPQGVSSEPATGGGKGAIVLELLAVMAAVPFFDVVAEQFGEFRLALFGTLVSLLLAHYFLKRRGLTWWDLGLRRPDSLWKTLACTVAVIVTVFLVGGLVNGVLLPALGLELPDLSAFKNLPGNGDLLLFWLVMSWISGGVIEEMLARGFFLNRFRDLFQNSAYAFPLAAVAQAALFGLAHFYQGLSGVIATSAIGLVMGIYYLVGKRSLWPLIVAHGMVDTVGVVAIYLGALSA